MLAQFFAWLNQPLAGRQAVKFSSGMAGISFVYSMATTMLTSALGIAIPERDEGQTTEMLLHKPLLLLMTLSLVVVAEELLFRHILTGWFYHHFGKNRPAVLILLIVVTSALYGVLHGNPVFICIQGVVGILFAIVYLKCGGLTSKRIKGMIYSSITHFAYNAALLGIVFMATKLLSVQS